jgi:hypothetical protein
MVIGAYNIAQALNGRRSPGQNESYLVKCPCHKDRSPSLRVTQKQDRILVYCNAGCDNADIIRELKAMGLWPTADRVTREKFRQAEIERKLFRDRIVLAAQDNLHAASNHVDKQRIALAKRRLRDHGIIS